MKRIMIFLSMAVLLLTGCKYESPLTEEHSIAIDSAVLGLWEPIPNEGEESGKDKPMVILKYSDTEYLIYYRNLNDGIYYRAYPIEIGGVSCVQLQLVGDYNGPPNPYDKQLFHVVSYQLAGDKLKIEKINSDLVDENLKTTDELRKSFLKHKDNKQLFNNPEIYRRIKKDSSLF